MKRLIPIPLICAFVTFAAICSQPAAASVQGTFQRTFQVTGPVDLEVLTRSGDIIVHSGPAGSVSITGKIHVGSRWFSGNWQTNVSELEKNPPIRQNGNSIRIEYVNFSNIAIDYEITAPANTRLRTHSGSGDQTVEGLHADLDLESGSGDMQLRDIQGDIHLQTGSGDVRAQGISGGLDAGAGSGDIRIEANGPGNVRVHTGSGNIELRGINGTLRAEAGSGDITVDGAQTGIWDVRTGSGNVDLRLPANAAFNLQAATSSGDLVVNQPVTITVQGNVESSRHRIEGKVRGGGPLLMVHTGSGDLHID